MTERLAPHWGEAARIQPRTVAVGSGAGQSRRPTSSIDETAFQHGHEYVTVVTDLDRARVLYVPDAPPWSRNCSSGRPSALIARRIPHE